MFKNNASKQTISIRQIKDRLVEVKQRKYEQSQVVELIKTIKYEINKASVVNPFYQCSKQSQKHSSKTKA